MKIKVPKTVKIGANQYSVFTKKDMKFHEGHNGESSHIRQVIVVDAIYPPTENFSTLLHECLHLISDQYYCELDEANIERLSNGLCDVLINSFQIELDWSDIEELN